MFIARRAVFRERELMSKEARGSRIYLEEIRESTNIESDVGTSSQQQVVEPTIRRSDRVRHAPERYNLLIYDGDDTHVDLHEPTSYREAMAGPEAAK